RWRMNVEWLEERCVPSMFTVNSLADLSIAAGVNPATGAINGTNTVTLRSAIQAANLTPSGNTINLALPGTYRITLPRAAQDNNATGDFDILATGGNLTIQNTSGGRAVVDGGSRDRVFDINPNFDAAHPTPAFTVTFQGFTITGGRAFDPTGANVDGGIASGGGVPAGGNASPTQTH